MADQRITELDEELTPLSTDLLAIVDDPGGSPVTKKSTIANVIAAMNAGARVYHNADQNISNITWTAIALNSERYDTNGFHDTVTNNSYLTVPAGLGGTYMIGGHLVFATNTTGIRQIAIRLNGSTFLAVQGTPAAMGYVLVATCHALVAGGYVELLVYQNSGGTLAAKTFGDYSPEFWIQKIG